MAAPYFWSNVSISIESARGTAQAISSITQADPGVASFASDPSFADGDFLLFDVEGMTELDDRVVRADSPAGAGPYTVNLEGINTTDYEAFSSGSAYEVTFGNTLNKTTGVSVSGGDAQFEEFSYIQDTMRRRVPVAYNPWQMSFECVWDPADTTLSALQEAADTFSQKAVKVAASGGYPIMVFSGYVGFANIPTGQAQGLIRTTLTIDAIGRPVFYTAAPA